MTGIVDRLLARRGLTRADINPKTALGKSLRGKSVPNSHELQRIVKIPRRIWQEDPDQSELTEALSVAFRLPGSTATLFPEQARALWELTLYRGCLGWLPVGVGKSLTGYLAQCALESKRMLLLLPANLQKEKTPKELVHYRKDWHIPEFRTMSYETLSRKDGEKKLRDYDPDLIVADESQALKNPKAALVRKLARFFDDYPDIPFLPMTGTPLSGGLEGVHHLIRWSLPPHLRPLPEKKEQLLEWAYAVDYRVDITQRLAPGALTQFCNDRTEASSLDGVRTALGRRFVETPGIVSSPSQDCAANIVISSIELDLPKVVEDAFEGIHEYGETPDGHSFAEAAQGWAHMHECALGFYYRWNPRAPDPWMKARKEFHRQIREILASNRRGLDSMLMVVNAIDRGEYDPEPLAAWRAIQPSFKPNPEAVWFDDTALKASAAWLQKPGLCWVYHREFGKRLSELTGVPYYGSGGKDAQDNSIEHVKGGPAILSLTSNKFGRNLQYSWSRNLVTYWPPTALDSEQFMGRTHRKGQLADNVSFEVLIGCRVQWENITKARIRAVDEQQKTQIKQKLLLGDYLVAEPIGKKGYLWK